MKNSHVGLFVNYLEFEIFHSNRLREVLKFQARSSTFESAPLVFYEDAGRLFTFVTITHTQ